MRKKINFNMKKSIAMITAGSLIMSTIATVNIKAASLDQLYKNAYDTAMRVKTIAEKNGVKAFFTSGKVSGTKEVVKAVQQGLQKDINDARWAQRLLLESYPEYINAVETFSSLVDNYQHPIYERIVSELQTMGGREFNQLDINAVKQLIEVVPEEFKANFSNVLDSHQQTYIDKVIKAIEQAESTKNKADLDSASKLADDLITVVLNQDVDSFAKNLKSRVDRLRIKVKEVKVINSNTIELKGEGLNALVSEYLTLSGNTVELIDATKNGSSAKIVFKDNFPPNSAKTLDVNINDNKQSFSINYEYKIKSVSINNEKYIAGKSNQRLAIRINGEKADADLNYLRQAGYDINFTAKDKDPVNIFKGGYNNSKTGELADDIYEGKFEITVEISKNGEKDIVGKQSIEVEKSSNGGDNNNSKVTVSSAYINSESYNYRKSGQKITFKINGSDKNCDLSYLASNGYSVKFSAINNKNEAAKIFVGDGSSTSGSVVSTTGVLKDQLEVGTYTVQMQIYKDGYTTISAKQTIEVIDSINNIASIGNVLMKNDLGTELLEMNSTTLVVGEDAIICEIEGTVKGQNGVMIIPNDYVEVTSSNKAIADVAVNGKEIRILAMNVGNAVITLKSGTVKKDIYMRVVGEDRRLSKVVPSESTVKVVTGKERKYNLLFLDQYGDPMRVSTDENISPDKNTLVKIEMNQGTGPKVATVTPLNVTTLSEDGRYLGFGVTGSNKGSATLSFKDGNDRVLWQGSVYVSDKDDYKESRLEFFHESKITKNTLEVGQEAIYQVSAVNSEGMFNGLLDLAPSAKEGYLTVKSDDTDIARVIVEKNTFKVIGKKEGSTYIKVENTKGVIQNIRVNVVSSTVSNIGILSVNFITNPMIDYSGRKITVKDVLDIREDGTKDKIVYGIEHNKTTIFPVRIDSSGELYIDEDNNGLKDEIVDIPLGKVILVKSGILMDAIEGVTTLPGDSYRMDFKILVDRNKNHKYEVNEVLTSTSISVSVKK